MLKNKHQHLLPSSSQTDTGRVVSPVLNYSLCVTWQFWLKQNKRNPHEVICCHKRTVLFQVGSVSVWAKLAISICYIRRMRKSIWPLFQICGRRKTALFIYKIIYKNWWSSVQFHLVPQGENLKKSTGQISRSSDNVKKTNSDFNLSIAVELSRNRVLCHSIQTSCQAAD